MPRECKVLLLRGGAAEALIGAGEAPDRGAGISIGAINAALFH